MEPTLRRGDLIIVGDLSGRRPIVGDIVVFRSKRLGELVIHRLKGFGEVDGRYLFYTRGDASDSNDDEPAGLEDLVGIFLWRLPRAAFPIYLLRRIDSNA